MIVERYGRLFILVLTAVAATLNGQQRRGRLDGYVGGPYKVVARDVTGDKLADIVLGYHQLGVVEVARGDGRGNLTRLAINDFSDQDRRIHSDDSKWSVPHVHNMAFGDLNGDGLPDLLAAVGGRGTIKKGRVLVARNLGRGSFERVFEVAVPSEAKGVRLADLDRDGKLDMLYTARGSGYAGDLKVGRLYLRRGLGGWKFGPPRISPAGRSAYYVEVADLNNDRFLDIIVPNEHDSCATCFLNPGGTIFSTAGALRSRVVRATRIPGRRSHAVNDVRAADFNGDGNQDLLTANLGTSTVSLFAGRGDGTFAADRQLDAGKNGAFLSVGDWDGDKDIDFAITHWTEDFVSVFLNTGDGTFAPRKDYPTASGNYGVDAADLNGDGHLDLVTANYRAKSMSVLLGKGDGAFGRASTIPRSLRSVNGSWRSADR